MKNQQFRIDQRGVINTLLIPLVLIVLLLVAAVGFGLWAFSSRQDYKNNVDQKVTAAVTQAKQQQAATDAVNYAQAAKNPLRTYTGPSAYGSINVLYPKTWSAYVITASQNGSSTPLNGYFEPDVVPDTSNQSNTYALRVEVTQQAYDQVLQGFNSLVQQNQATVTPYSLPKVPSIVGVKVTGQIEQNVQGTMVILPLRDTTLQIWTESNTYQTDFTNTILPNFSFSP